MKLKEDFLNYQNPPIIDRYIKCYKSSQQEANTIWQELMKYFYLIAYCNHHQMDIELPFLEKVNNKIDDMWHTFLLFTKDYREFCHDYCGTFIDHIPEINNQETNSSENPTNYQQAKQQIKDFIKLVYQIWGKETFDNWFVKRLYK